MSSGNSGADIFNYVAGSLGAVSAVALFYKIAYSCLPRKKSADLRRLLDKIDSVVCSALERGWLHPDLADGFQAELNCQRATAMAIECRMMGLSSVDYALSVPSLNRALNTLASRSLQFQRSVRDAINPADLSPSYFRGNLHFALTSRITSPGGTPNSSLSTITTQSEPEVIIRSTVDSAPDANVSLRRRPRAISPESSSTIWGTSSTEERDRVNDFWLGLGEDKRWDLVKTEKDTIIGKMKEQHRNSCPCAACERKRRAIETQVEDLYNAYYEELEQLAVQQQSHASSSGTGTTLPGPGPFPGSAQLDRNGSVADLSLPKESVRQLKQWTNGELLETAEDDEGDDRFGKNGGSAHHFQQRRGSLVSPAHSRLLDPWNLPASRKNGLSTPLIDPELDVPNLGSSLATTGPGNDLTVGIDLRNEGQTFLEMMEQLAQRRIELEEEATSSVEDNPDELGDNESYEDEEEEEEVMREEQKSEDGKRMFSNFAARMLERRVLQAYRQKVAQERQLQLLRDLKDEEEQAQIAISRRRARNQKKREKEKLRKQRMIQERADTAAAKAGDEEAAKRRKAALEDRKHRYEEHRQRQEARRKTPERRIEPPLPEEKEHKANRNRGLKEEEGSKTVQRQREECKAKARKNDPKGVVHKEMQYHWQLESTDKQGGENAEAPEERTTVVTSSGGFKHDSSPSTATNLQQGSTEVEFINRLAFGSASPLDLWSRAFIRLAINAASELQLLPPVTSSSRSSMLLRHATVHISGICRENRNEYGRQWEMEQRARGRLVMGKKAVKWIRT